jgi:nucleoside-diphosphate-sugar epimerase
VRPSVIYGPNNRGNVYNLIRQVLSPAFVYPNRKNIWKSVCFVENVASFFVYLLAMEATDATINYCDDPQLTTYDLVRMIRRAAALRRPLIEVPPWSLLALSKIIDRGPRKIRDRFGSLKVEKFMRCTRLSNARSRAIGFRQPITTEAGLRRTVEWVVPARRNA